MRWSICVGLLILFSPFEIANAQDAATQNSVGQLVQHLMSIEVGFEQMVPPGMSIETKEVSREGQSGKDLVVQYHIFVKGVPPNTLFRALNWPPNAEKPSVTLEGISVGKDGVLMCAGRNPEQCGDPKKPDDPIEFTVLPMKGEPSRFAFVSSDIRIGTVIVADPITAKDKACTISLVRLTRAFELAFMSGSGYPPNADVHYTVSSEMTSNSVIKADSNGTIRVGLIPYPGKKKEGTARVKINEAACAPEASWDWGPIEPK
jgi:hypothetical protein